MAQDRVSGDLLIRAGSVALIAAAWTIAAALANDPQLLPGPVPVARKMASEAANGELWIHLFATLMRVLAAFVLALATGIAAGMLMGRNRTANSWLDTLLVLMLNLPALVVIVLCYLWIGLTEAAAITAVALNKIPTVVVMIREGARALDPRLDQVASVFHVPLGVRIRHFLAPQMAPYIAAASRSGLSLIWKIVLVVEFLGRPNGIGFQIHLGFQLFDVTLVLAYALAFVIVMLAAELLIIQPYENRANPRRRA
jgi:NitT/TauT family transport system permease protein